MPRSPGREWRIRIEDILGAIGKIRSYTEGMSLEQFRENQMVVEAVLYNVTIIGEAARFVPEHVAARQPGVEWSRMRALRNVAVHEYFGADLAIVWQTLSEDLFPLVPRLRAILDTEP